LENKVAQENLAKRYEEDLRKINDSVTDVMQPIFKTTEVVEVQRKEMDGLRKNMVHIQKEMGGAIRTLVEKIHDISLLGGGGVQGLPPERTHVPPLAK
jgi:predicted  nucleic acid-binding Zn-ribbon protein